MSIIVPPFVQYQAPLVPLRGLWNAVPPEGDRFVNADIIWGVTTGPGLAVQFALAGNSPVAMSQIAALAVDNGRCGADVQFLFPDSGSVLQVPGYNQGLYPVFTNALMFYVTSPSAALGDQTLFQILNSVPPPIAVQPTQEQSQAIFTSLDLHTNGITQIIPAGVSGTIEAASLMFQMAQGVAAVSLIDGLNNILWVSGVGNGLTTLVTENVPLSGLRLRFFNGLRAQVATSTFAAGTATANLNIYYGVP